MITIKENDKPKLKNCKLKCDVPLDEKLDKYDLTKFFNCHQSTVICGKPQSGKTSLLYSLFKSKHILKGVYDKVLCIYFNHQHHEHQCGMIYLGNYHQNKYLMNFHLKI